MDNRDTILACAEKLFYTKGYDGTGVQEIVTTAGITKPTLYYYFGNKRGLLETLIETKFRVLYNQLDEVVRAPGEIRSKLQRFARVFYRFYIKEHDFYMMFMTLVYSAGGSEAYACANPFAKELIQQTIDMFELAGNELGNMNGRQAQFAFTFIGVLNQFLLYCENADAEEDAGQRLTATVNQYMYGIFS